MNDFNQIYMAHSTTQGTFTDSKTVHRQLYLQKIGYLKEMVAKTTVTHQRIFGPIEQFLCK